MDRDEWWSGYRERLAAVGARAAQVQRELADVEGTASSGDGAVTVTVGAAGALRRLEFGERAARLPRGQLAGVVLSTAQEAGARAARQAMEVVEPLVGARSEAARVLRTYLPEAPA